MTETNPLTITIAWSPKNRARIKNWLYSRIPIIPSRRCGQSLSCSPTGKQIREDCQSYRDFQIRSRVRTIRTCISRTRRSWALRWTLSRDLILRSLTIAYRNRIVVPNPSRHVWTQQTICLKIRFSEIISIIRSRSQKLLILNNILIRWILEEGAVLRLQITFASCSLVRLTSHTPSSINSNPNWTQEKTRGRISRLIKRHKRGNKSLSIIQARAWEPTSQWITRDSRIIHLTSILRARCTLRNSQIKVWHHVSGQRCQQQRDRTWRLELSNRLLISSSREILDEVPISQICLVWRARTVIN